MICYFHFRGKWRQTERRAGLLKDPGWEASSAAREPSLPSLAITQNLPRLLRTTSQKRGIPGKPSLGVLCFWDAPNTVSERLKWGPPCFGEAGKGSEPSSWLACSIRASFRCRSKDSPSIPKVSSLAVVYFFELTPLKNIKVRTWLKNLLPLF